MDRIGISQTPDHGTSRKNKSQNNKTLNELVYKKLLEVPQGQITTYGDLAKAVGLKNAQRAIGKIMNRNPYPAIVPCHRVVKSDGNLGGYAYGTDIKENMLCREGLQISKGKILNMKSIRYRF